MSVKPDIQRLAVGDIVEMFILDASLLSNSDGVAGSIHRFCSSIDNETAVVWQTYTYQPYPIEAEGFDRNSQGQLPQPKLRIADVSGMLGSIINEYDDLLGAVVTRIRTLRKFLDGEVTADPTAEFPQEVYRVERKSIQTKRSIELILSSPFDLHGLKLPARVVLKQTCLHRYRAWDGSAFDYTKATCPYTGTSYWDRLGATCIEPLDECGKRLTDCLKRFPKPAILPTWAFPGVFNVRK